MYVPHLNFLHRVVVYDSVQLTSAREVHDATRWPQPACHLLPIPIRASSIRSSSSPGTPPPPPLPPPAPAPPWPDEALECGEANGRGDGAGDLTMCTDTDAGDGRLPSSAAIISCCVVLVLLLPSSGMVPPVADDCAPAPLIAFISIIEAAAAAAAAAAIELTPGGVLVVVVSVLLPVPSCDECEWFDIVLLGRDGGLISAPASASFEALPEMGEGNGGSTIEPVAVGVPGAEPDRNPSLLELPPPPPPPESIPGEARPAEGNMLPSELFDLLWSVPSLPNIFCTMLGSRGCSAADPPAPSTDAMPPPPGPLEALFAAAAPSRSESNRALASPEGDDAVVNWRNGAGPPAPADTCAAGEDDVLGFCLRTVASFCALLLLDPPSPGSPAPLAPALPDPPLPPPLFDRADSFGIWNLVSSDFANPSMLPIEPVG
uniref:Uncharacterized protein n=1 Tax=Anopheles dirus TaxID=7168 RepID=A0A182NYD0_9DIPT